MKFKAAKVEEGALRGNPGCPLKEGVRGEPLGAPTLTRGRRPTTGVLRHKVELISKAKLAPGGAGGLPPHLALLLYGNPLLLNHAKKLSLKIFMPMLIPLSIYAQ